MWLTYIYSMHIYHWAYPAGSQIPCSVRLLLRHGSQETVLLDLPNAFTAIDSFETFSWTTGASISAWAQAGDTLVLKIVSARPSVYIWMNVVDSSRYPSRLELRAGVKAP